MDEIRYRASHVFAVCTGSNQDQRHFCFLDEVNGVRQDSVVRHGIITLVRLDNLRGTSFFCDVFGQFQQDRARTLFLGSAEGFAHKCRDGIAVYDLLGHLADGIEQVDDIDDLKQPLF